MSLRTLTYSLSLTALLPAAIQAEQPEQPSTAVVVSSELGTAKWLKESCTAAVDVFARKEGQVTATDTQSIKPAWLMISATMWAFDQAFRVSGPEKSSEIFVSPPEWCSYDVVARSVLKFMQRYSDMIDDTTPAETVVAAWYFSEHPKTTDEEKGTALNSLRRRPTCRLPVKD